MEIVFCRNSIERNVMMGENLMVMGVVALVKFNKDGLHNFKK